jgi:outer membrane murein-binding lipoprotein Lpp
MKNFKKNIALLSAIAMAGAMLAGCGDTTTTDDSSSDASADTTAAADASADDSSSDDSAASSDDSSSASIDTSADTGKVLRIAAWNEEFKGLFETYYAGTAPIGDTGEYYADAPGLPDGVTYEFVITANEGNAYQDKLDQDLQNQASAEGDDLLDMFLFEADYALKYVNTDYTLDVKSIGLTDSDLSDMYQYTKDICTDESGALKGVSWQATPGLFAYRRSIAQAVLGSDDPDTVQAAVADWDTFNETAAKVKEAGYYMLSGYDDAYRTFSNNVSAPWVDENKTIVIDDNLMAWVDQTKEFTDNGYNQGSSLWDDAWAQGQSASGQVFGYFYSTWGVNFTLKGNAGDDGFGDWGVCEGPQSYYWGGSWLAACAGTDNANLVADIMKFMTCNADTMTAITENTEDYTNNQTAMNALANSDYSSDFLGGQNHIALFAEAAPKIDMSNISAYDQGLNEAFQAAFKDYFTGAVDKDTALENFYTAALEKYPGLSR